MGHTCLFLRDARGYAIMAVDVYAGNTVIPAHTRDRMTMQM